MDLFRRLNALLASRTGFRVCRARPKPGPAPGRPAAASHGAPRVFRLPAEPELDRLLRRPAFVLAPVCAGSSLLRRLLAGHPQLHVPPEVPLRQLEARIGPRPSATEAATLEPEPGELEQLLWDRVLHRELAASGKSFLMDATPGNVFAYRRVAVCWPDARFVFLLRHPAAVARAWHAADPDRLDAEQAAVDALRYLRAVDRARRVLPGHTVRHEDLTAQPAAVLRDLCAFLDVAWEPELWELPEVPEPPERPEPPSGGTPEPLRELCASWGYDPAPVREEHGA